jgi:hypothetical protein
MCDTHRVKQTQNVCFVTSPDSVLNPESAPIEVPLVFKDDSFEIDESVSPDSAPLGAVCNYILILGPKLAMLELNLATELRKYSMTQ